MRTFDPGPITKSRRVTKLISETEWANALERHCRSDVEAYLQGDSDLVRSSHDPSPLPYDLPGHGSDGPRAFFIVTSERGTLAFLCAERRYEEHGDEPNFGDVHDAQTGEYIGVASSEDLSRSLDADLQGLGGAYDGGHRIVVDESVAGRKAALPSSFEWLEDHFWPERSARARRRGAAPRSES